MDFVCRTNPVIFWGGLQCIKDLTKRKRLKIWSMPKNNRQGGWYRSLQVCESVRGRVGVYNTWECASIHKCRRVHGMCNSASVCVQEYMWVCKCKCGKVQVYVGGKTVSMSEASIKAQPFLTNEKPQFSGIDESVLFFIIQPTGCSPD